MPLKNETINILNVKHSLNMNNKCISNLGYPLEETDAANKEYVDKMVSSSGSSKGLIVLGKGLKRQEDDTIGLDGPVNVNLGGTGANSFERGVVLLGNDENALAHTKNLKWDFQTSTLHLPNVKVSICNTDDVRSRRCSTETLSSVNLGSQKGVITHMTTDKLNAKHIASDQLEAGKFVRYYEPQALASETSMKITPEQLLSGLLVRSKATGSVNDVLPTASELVDALKKMNCAKCGVVIGAFYQNESENEIVLTVPVSPVAPTPVAPAPTTTIKSGQTIELTLLVTNVTKNLESYKVFYRM